MAAIATMVYEYRKREPPFILALPILRGGFENDLLLPYVRLPKPPKRILIVDDEIGACTTALASFQLLNIAYSGALPGSAFHVLAQQRSNYRQENLDAKGITCNSYTMERHGETNVIMRFFRPLVVAQLHSIVERVPHFAARTLNVAFNVPIKEVACGCPYFSVSPHAYAALHISKLASVRQEFADHMLDRIIGPTVSHREE